jgi:hypothetical protein
MKPLFKYIHDTKRFAKAYGELILPEGQRRGTYAPGAKTYQPLSHPGTDKPRAPPKERKPRQTRDRGKLRPAMCILPSYIEHSSNRR